jgi:hypothetical protein
MSEIAQQAARLVHLVVDVVVAQATKSSSASWIG